MSNFIGDKALYTLWVVLWLLGYDSIKLTLKLFFILNYLTIFGTQSIKQKIHWCITSLFSSSLAFFRNFALSQVTNDYEWFEISTHDSWELIISLLINKNSFFFFSHTIAIKSFDFCSQLRISAVVVDERETGTVIKATIIVNICFFIYFILSYSRTHKDCQLFLFNGNFPSAENIFYIFMQFFVCLKAQFGWR